jgi:MscS family membrane protein
LRRRGVATDDREIESWVRPVRWLAALWLLVQGVAILDLRMGFAGALLAVLVPAFWLAAALAAYQLIDPVLKLVAGPGVTQEGATTLAAMGFPVLALVLKIVVLACGLAAVLTLFNFDVGTVLAGLGIGGLAFALAAQDTLKNFFGSIMLIADRTFRVGDLVQIGGNEGIVESVGLRTTRIRGLDDSLLTIPNSDLTTAHVTNFGARRYRRFRTRITVPYGTPPECLIEFRDGILGLLRQNAQVRQPTYEVAVNDLGPSGIEILIQVFFAVPDGHAELLARDALILDTLRLAERLGIAFERPTVFLERQAGTGTGVAPVDSVPLSSAHAPPA